MIPARPLTETRYAFRDGALLALPDRPEPALRNGAFA